MALPQSFAQAPLLLLVDQLDESSRQELVLWYNRLHKLGFGVVAYCPDGGDGDSGLPKSLRLFHGPEPPPASHARIAIGLDAVHMLLGPLDDDPLWVDLGAMSEMLRREEPATEDPYEFWDAYSRVLDRGDGFSVATAADAEALHQQLALRSRFASAEESRERVAVLSDEVPPVLLRWLRKPRRSPHRFQLPGSSERQLRTWLEDNQSQLQAIHSSRMWSFWMWTLKVRRGLDRRLGWLKPLTPNHGIRFAGLAALSGWGYRLAGRGFSGLRLITWAVFHESLARLRRLLRSPAPFEKTAPPEDFQGERPRVLLVSPYPIYPPNHGGGVRLYNLVKHLGPEVELYLLIFRRDPETDDIQREALEAFCEKVYYHLWEPRFESSPWTTDPPNARLFSSHRAEFLIRDLIARHGIEVLQLEYTELAGYRRVAGPDVQVILVEHDIAFRSFRRRRGLGFHRRFPDSRAFGASALDATALTRYEVLHTRQVEQLHVMSPEDGQFLSHYLGDGTARMRVVPNAVDTAYYRPEGRFEDRRGVLFVGNFENLPNLDAFEFFTIEVWPLLRQRLPEVELSVIGAKMPEAMKDWDGRDGIRIVGTVPDMRPGYHEHRVLACPIRVGSGTRLKLLEAFAAGIPSVATAIAAEGLDAVDGEHLLLAEEPADFAEALARVLEDDDLAEGLSKSGMELAVARYDWAVPAAVNLASYYELLPAQRRPAPKPSERPWAGEGETPEVSVLIPTLNGGELLARTLEAICSQATARNFEVICVDSGSRPEDLAMMESFQVGIHGIQKSDFNHGLTRDLAASLARGEILLFLNQDAIPRDALWLERMLAPFDEDPELAAVQGGILEIPHGEPFPVRRFFWDSCGERFYFTSESRNWIERFRGVGFSTVNSGLRRSVWEKVPFGWAPFMEDKKWQRAATEAGYRIAAAHEAAVYHTHDYDLRSLGRRCRSEGYGWRLLGEEYRVVDMLRDLARPYMVVELLKGLVRGRGWRPAELIFPWYRPAMLWIGNRFGHDVEH